MFDFNFEASICVTGWSFNVILSDLVFSLDLWLFKSGTVSSSDSSLSLEVVSW